MLKSNKKATSDSFAMSPWLFIVLGVVTLCIMIGVSLYYSKFIDVRIDEAKILTDKLTEAISYNGYLNQEILNNNFDIFKIAGLNKDLFNNPGNFYFNLIIYGNNGIEIKNIEEGTKDFKIQCEIPGEKMAVCYKKMFYLLDKNNPSKYFLVKIVAGSNQQGAKI
jgi:hypothetical protein